MNSEVEAYIQKKGWQYRVQGDNLVLTVCPFCGNTESKFSIHVKMGLYQCWSGSCGQRGNLYTLKQQQGDLGTSSKVAEVFGNEEVTYDVVPRDDVRRWHQQLLANPAALGWVYGRGLGNDAIEAFQLGVDYQDSGQWLTIPYFKDGQCVNIKSRALPPLGKDFRIRAKHEKPLYNCDCLKNQIFKEVILCEGEIDCITLSMMGYPNVVSLPSGAGNFSSDHWDMLVAYEKVFLVLDPDGAGRTGMKAIATRLGEDRCYDVRIPNGMDPNEMLQKYGYVEAKQRFDVILADAKVVGKGEVSGVRSALEELAIHLSDSGSIEGGYSSPWPSVNRVLGTLSPGEVLLLQAIPKTGKTTLAQQWLSWLAKEFNVPTMMYCLEMPLWRLAQSLVAGTVLKNRSVLTTLDVKMTLLRYMDAPFYYGAIPKQWDFDHIKEVITYAVKRFGVKAICFDNLQLLCRNTKEVFAEQASVSRNFKALAIELDIAIILVVQPRKIDPRSSPGMYDPSGSGSIIADADGMMVLWRKPLHSSEDKITDEDLQTQESESFGPETLIRIPASRYRPGGQALLHFTGDCATFSEVGSMPHTNSQSVEKSAGPGLTSLGNPLKI